jgi:hypothetical protein
MEADGEVTRVTIEEERVDDYNVNVRVTLLGPRRLFVVVFRPPIIKTQRKLIPNFDGIVYESGREGIEIDINEPAGRAYITPFDRRGTKFYTATVAVAKKLKKDLFRYSVEARQASEVAMAPRRAVGPLREDGRVPRDPTFEPLPIGVVRNISEYLGGKTRKAKSSRRRKTTRLENVSRKSK